MSSPPVSNRQAPLSLWRAAGAFLDTLFNLFGAAKDVAVEHTLTAKSHALFVSWLRVGEMLLRHLLFLEAAALPDVPPLSKCTSPPTRRSIGA